MIVMAQPISPFFHNPSFDAFLFAAIGEEQNGMLLSVLSALARLELDPWREAESLSKLPASAATERLTALLSSLPSTQITAPPPALITRLLALLPHTARHDARSSGSGVAAKSDVSRPTALYVIFACVMLFAAQFVERIEFKRPTGGIASPAVTQFDPGAPKRGAKIANPQ